MKKQENTAHDRKKNKYIEIDPELMQILELADRTFKEL